MARGKDTNNSHLSIPRILTPGPRPASRVRRSYRALLATGAGAAHYFSIIITKQLVHGSSI